LGAVLSDIDRGFATGNVLGLGGPGAGAHHANRCQRAGGLVIMMPTAEFRIELGQCLERVTGSLRSGSRDRRSATTGAATSGRNHRRLTDGAERRVAHART